MIQRPGQGLILPQSYIQVANRFPAVPPPVGETYIDKVLSYSPIAYWPLNESSGTTADNAEGTAAMDGTYSQDVATLTTGTGIGDGNTAPLFNGSGDFMNFYTATFKAAFDGQLGSLSVWFKVSGAGVWTDSQQRRPMAIYTAATDRILLDKNSTSNQMQFYYIAGGTNKNVQKSSFSPTAWFQVLLTWSKANDRYRVYINGSQEGADQTSVGTWTTGSNTEEWNIGAENTSGNLNWDGYAAHAAVFDTELDSTDATDLATV